MNNTNTGGPAFPQCSYNMKGGYDITGGMTLRDYFAAEAIQGFCSTLGEVTGEPYWNVMATDAYKLADAMLKAREA